MSYFIHVARAVDYTLPAIQRAPESAGPAGWVSNLYQFALLGAGLLAFGVIVYAGLMYALHPGGHSAQSDAKDRITQALLGLLLLLGAFLILRTINPNLVSLPTDFELKPLEAPAELETNTPTTQTPTPVGSPRFQCPGKPTCWTDQQSCSVACGGQCVTAGLGACP